MYLNLGRISARVMGRMGRMGRICGPCGPQTKGPAHWRALDFIGAGEKSRTPDLRITNALLYQLSYTGTVQRRKL